MQLPAKLIELRRERAISQEKLAEIIGVSRQSVAKWETGECLPEVERLIQLSDYFLVTIDSLVKESQTCSGQPGSMASPANNQSLIDFLLKAKRACYAGHGAETSASRLNSHDLRYQEGPLFYYDSYLGGQKFAGEEAVWQDDQPIWCMNYIGRVLDERFSGDFLKEALALVGPEFPYRGPLIHRNGEYSYHCQPEGDFTWYVGSEEIFYSGTKIYECRFHGGAVQP